MTSSLKNSGFTLIELLLVMGIFAILSSIVLLTLLRPQTKASLEAATTILVSDLRLQQTKSMNGETAGGSATESFGIYFQTNQYTLFKGTTYSAGDTSNLVIAVETPLSLSTNLPSSQVVFAKQSGQVSSFSSSANQIILTDTASGQQRTLTLNEYGVVLGN